ncbi:ROK family glucokinase [Amphibacillus cookii]|uniref:ROK family glucokinase n=1 Tax=Amphibacillus cookii TaxID=767787 RepID=UPI00195B0AF4|nr:ROK family glucokinase [Amphibacillus cookii]MBM7542406.1 glucokinase [Amphibacillus cookii]
MSKYLIGVDIGGTTVKIGIISTTGEIIDKWEIATNKGAMADRIPNDIWDAITDKLAIHQIEKQQILGIGAGAPGFVVADSGDIAEAVNLGWRDFPLGRILTDLSGLPVYVDNDANIAALGENWLGSGQLADHLIAITLGTGVGGGIIVDGKIVSGVNGTAGEIGHMTIERDGAPCNCGRRGCLETIASATGIARIATEKVKKTKHSTLTNILKENKILTAKNVFEAAAQGDPCANEVITEVVDVLAFAISNVATVINPSKIVIGGGVSKAGDQLLIPLKNAYQRYALPRISEGSTFAIATLGNDAGIIGAAFLVKQHQS